MAPLRHAVHILPDVMIKARQADQDGHTAAFASLEPRLELLVDDLVWWTATLAAGRRHDQCAGT